MLHDPDVYAEPEKFNPDRFLKGGQIDTDVKDPQAYSFGSGRRLVSFNFTNIFHLFVFTYKDLSWTIFCT